MIIVHASRAPLLLLTALLGGAALFPAHAQAGDLAKIQSSGKFRIGFSTDTPGLVTWENGKAAGFAVEVVDMIAKDIKVKGVTWQKVATPEQLVKDLRAGKLDAIMDVNLPLQLDNVARQAPFTCTGGVLLSRPGGPEFEEDIKGQRIAVATNSPYFYYVRNLPFEKKVNVFANSDQALLAFLSGSVDSLVLDRFDALKMYNRVGAKKLHISSPLWNQHLQLVTPGSSRRDSALSAAYNVAFTKLEDNGTYARLSKKYFQQDVSCEGWN
ncbi:substrate-binding periplasmic protein [Deinococcus hopiensis]|uniref:Polar amino acid transport system substrate-binding protein n=1 Tax=Deinococcus hopiensis KR-140 TaxID=695939 RepID=A0A1W1VW14_9DEIO|nr:transporter substrate-binding domain-containing protein [Deinococcus hopiensis]SMB97562.1 polar amino acid transport system substrate-binding protein [Deinococcus hopiensis KR-140]